MTDVHGNHLAKVRIKDLLLRAYIGIKEEEINNQQDVLINVALTYDASEAVNRNEISAALNYRTITKQIIGAVFATLTPKGGAFRREATPKGSKRRPRRDSDGDG